MNYEDRHQSRTWQRKIISAAAANGQLHQLRWYIEMDIPSTHRRGPGHRVQCASYPAGFVPTVPLDEDGADDYAHLLLELFRSANPDSTFRIMLTDVPMLESSGIAHYIWGEDPPHVDTICAVCGMVGPGRPGRRLGCSKGCLA